MRSRNKVGKTCIPSFGMAAGGARMTAPDLFAEIATNLDAVLQCALLLGFSLNMMAGAVIIGWQLRSDEGRQAARTWLAAEEGDSIEGLITVLVIPTLGLLVVLCS